MVPRNPVHIGPDGRGFFGTVTVGQRGQVAIPAQARKNLGLESGDQLVVLTDPAQGLALIPLRLLLERAPDDPLAMLVRSTLDGRMPSGPGTMSGTVPGAPPTEDPSGDAGSAGDPLESSGASPSTSRTRTEEGR
jgi:hypothetical protein